MFSLPCKSFNNFRKLDQSYSFQGEETRIASPLLNLIRYLNGDHKTETENKCRNTFASFLPKSYSQFASESLNHYHFLMLTDP